MKLFDDQVAIVTASGDGEGKKYAVFLARFGARVVVNDTSKENADKVVKEIVDNGGIAIASYHSVLNGDKLVEEALQKFETVHILINNASCIRSSDLASSKDEDWDAVSSINNYGAYMCTRACWALFRKQKYGRVVNFTSSAGLYAAPGLSIYSATKMGMVGFNSSIAKEGAKYNILSNVLAPIISEGEDDKLPKYLNSKLNSDCAITLASFLCSKENMSLSGKIFEVAAGKICEVRMERAKGAVFKCDESLSPSDFLPLWDQINDFSEPDYPQNVTSKDYLQILQSTKNLPANKQGPEISLKGKVAVVTGAGNGLGRAYALLFAKLGAKLVINDVANPEKVVQEVKKFGVEAIGDNNSVENGEKIIENAVRKFGTIHILVNNAGILRDKSFLSLAPQLWTSIISIHAKGTYKCTKAAWKYFKKQSYGRVINTSSPSGLYGNFGQVNYSCAKMNITGFTLATAAEGDKYNIRLNVIAPTAGTNMTRTIFPEEYIQAFKPDYIASFVALLADEKCPSNGRIYEIGPAWGGRVRLQRSQGTVLSDVADMNSIKTNIEKIMTFSPETAEYPEFAGEAMASMVKSAISVSNSSSKDVLNNKNSSFRLHESIGKKLATSKFEYDEKDVILYNISIGASSKDLKWVYEQHADFEALPTFGLLPIYSTSSILLGIEDLLPNFEPLKLLHGEHYFEICQELIPTHGKLVNETYFEDLADKKTAAAVVMRHMTKDSKGKLLFKNEALLFCRGAGKFGGKSTLNDRGFASRDITIPKQDPDAIRFEKTSENQAIFYRLLGDFNPIHIDPDLGLFDKPILHGLCHLGISGKLVYGAYGKIRKLKCRFTNVFYPGETIKVDMWKNGNEITFRSSSIERKSAVIIGILELWGSETKKTSVDSSVTSLSGKYLAEIPTRFAKLSDEKKNLLLKQNGGIYQFDIATKDDQVDTWVLSALKDLQVSHGKIDLKVDCTLALNDQDLKSILEGRVSPTKLYLNGAMKVKGNLLKSQKLGRIFEQLPST